MPLVNGEQQENAEEEEDGEELFELASFMNGEISDSCSEARSGHSEEQPELSDFKEEDSASCQSETTLDVHRAIIEDIRFATVPFVMPIIVILVEVKLNKAFLWFLLLV